MGNKIRAKRMSDHFSNRTLKAIALYSFDKCGNCVNRIRCGEEILASGGKQMYPIKFIVDSMVAGCPKTQFQGKGFVAKEVAGFLTNECSICEKNGICIGYIVDHSKVDPQNRQAAIERLQGCLKCPKLDNCIHYFMTQLGITKWTLLKGGFLMKFRKCSQQNLIKTSLDLSAQSDPNVGGTLVLIPKKKEEEQ